mgnify:CR=1 FL=1
MQVREYLSDNDSKRDQLQQLLELGESRLHNMSILEQEQCRRKTFVDRHRQGNKREFEVGKAVLVFETRIGNMLGKLHFRWTGPY